jgi:hypothetical protein
MIYTHKSATPKLAGTPIPQRTLNPKGLTYAEMCAAERSAAKRRDGAEYRGPSRLADAPERVYRVIAENPGIGRDDAAKLLGVQRQVIIHHGARLEAEGRIVRKRNNTSEPFRYYPRAAQ